MRPAFFLVLLVLVVAGCGGAGHAPARRAVQVTFRCEDMERGRVMGAVIVHGRPRSAEPRYGVSRADAQALAHRLHARFSEAC